MCVISLYDSTNNDVYLELFPYLDLRAFNEVYYWLQQNKVYCWFNQSVFWPPLIAKDVGEALVDFYKLTIDAINMSKNSLGDTTFISWHQNLKRPHNYFLDSYTEGILLKEQLYRDKALWLYTNLGIYWKQNNHEMYISNNWNYLGSWKETDKIRNLGVYSFHSNFFSVENNLLISEFNNKYIRLKFEEGVIYKKYTAKDEIFNIIYTNPRSLAHHDFVSGQYLTTSLFWYNEELLNSQHPYKGLSLLWYERTGSVEAVLKLGWTFFYCLGFIEVVDGLDIYTTIFKSCDSLRFPVIEFRWNWYNSLYELEDLGWSTKHFWTGVTPNIFITQEPNKVFYGMEQYEWTNKIYYAMKKDDIEC